MKSDSSQSYPPGLYIVATPIGNLTDITLRALDTLRQADLIVCEDTRVTGKLSRHYDIRRPTLSYNDHNGAERRPKIIAALEQGERIALVSDAGTPLVSDPGYKLVREAIERGIHVSVLPGASSALAALCLSGLPTDRFFFAGFLPAKKAARKKEIHILSTIPSTLILFESAHRLADTLADLAEGLGEREAAVTREITKLFEESRRGSLPELQIYYEKNTVKGEIVIVIGPPGEIVQTGESIEAKLSLLLKSHSVKEAASIVAEETGRPRKEIYSLALKLMEDGTLF